MAGFIKTYRKISTHWLWNIKPYSPGQAWIDLLMLAVYKQNKGIFRGGFYDLHPGQLVTSDQTLANRWGWTRKKVRLFLQRLEKDEMLNNKRDNRKSIITICNWGDYQGYNEFDRTTEGSSEGQLKVTVNGAQKEQHKPSDIKGSNTGQVTHNGQVEDQVKVHNNKEYKNDKNIFFDEFWNIYDKKVDRSKALKLWNQLLDVEIRQILEYVPKYKGVTPDKQFRKDPATFLRNRSWENELPSLNQRNGNPTMPLKIFKLPNSKEQL